MTANQGAVMSVAVAATFSCDPIQRWLRFWFQEVGYDCRLAFAAYGQLQQELRCPKTIEGAAVCVCLLNLADWQRAHTSDTPFDVERFQADFDFFVEGLKTALLHCPHLLLVLCPSRPLPNAGIARRESFKTVSRQLLSLAEQTPRLSVVTTEQIAAWYPVQEIHDVVADEIGHIPYTESGWCAIAAACSRALQPVIAVPLKVVIADCDYTLWHHAVGEVGSAGIVCGSRHRELQQRLLDLRSRGVLLCLCSKNLEEDIFAALATEETLLTRNHIAATRIAPELCKATAVRELAAELQAAPESVIFLDDNPSECLSVRAMLPQVPTWCVPQVHAEWKNQLAHVWLLDVPLSAASSEDARRADLQQEEVQRRTLLAKAISPTDFHQQLQVRMQFHDLSSESPAALQERIIQLQHRTNQFNAWKRHPLPPDIFSKYEGLAMTVTDRFGDYGVVGAALCCRRDNVLRVLSWTMSCRVLGRGAEYALLARVATLALQEPACSIVKVGVVETERNQLARRFLDRARKAIAGSSVHSVDLESSQNHNSWESVEPDYWHTFPAHALSALEFNPEGAIENDSIASEKEVAGKTLEALPPAVEEHVQRLHKRAAVLSDMPISLRLVDQAMTKSGFGLLPVITDDNSSEPHSHRVLRALWRSVLQLDSDASAELHDEIPFAASGGDSVLAVQLISAAARHGIKIPHDANLEMLTLHQLFTFSSNLHEASISADQNMAFALPWGDSNAASASPESVKILERDSRTPKADLRVSGLTACVAGNLDKVKLLAAGGTWHAAYAVDRHKNTALMWSAGCGRLHVVRWLLEEAGVAVDVVNKDGRSALMWACKNGQLNVVEYLLNEGGANAMLRMKDDSTAFDWAVLGGHEPTMEYMAAHPDVDLHALNKFGCSAVQWAAASGKVNTCRWLYSKGIDFSHVNQARHGAVNKAAWKGHKDALRWMLLDPSGPQLGQQLLLLDHEGLTVAALARQGGHIDVAAWLEELAAKEAALNYHLSDLKVSAEEIVRNKARCAVR